ncbi:MAG: carbamate kinase [Candidatus Diapherotrites archaeon]|nr:carbamate kinase [Candidatus Diapherotrites archaeon]
MKLVVALGGNALIQEKQKGTIAEQFSNARKALDGVIKIIQENHNIVLTHGNGPQVGNILIRSQLGEGKAYGIPLGVADAQSQGEIGYMLEQCLQNKLNEKGIKKKVCCLLTQVLVDENDSAVKNPSKPVGPFLSKEKADELKSFGANVIEDAGRGYRRVVPSPNPIDIIEKKEIQALIDSGAIVICCGGGGIPVYYGKPKAIELSESQKNEIAEKGFWLEGMDAVIDKDCASALLGNQINADELMILTAVEKVYLNFGKENQKELNKITVKEAKQYLTEGHFAKGSMEPKIRAAISFIENGGKKVIISSIEKCFEAFKEKTGTIIVG